MRESLLRERTQKIKAEALRLGFSYCGVAKADYLEEEAPRLEDWLRQGHHGAMGYMENWFDLRLDPRKLVPAARSIITLLYNYHNPDLPTDASAPRISQYAYGEDYHHVIKRKMRELVQWMEEQIGAVEGRVFVDSAPVLERAWAKRSGVGWIGKNAQLIHPKAGSYFFLCEFISDLELAVDGPMKDYCGTCTACMEACPTDAIPQPHVVDGSRCISYFTIELKGSALPVDQQDRFGRWVFGCDICQEVCPWNRFAQRHREPAFEPHPDLLSMDAEGWKEITESVFRDLFRRSAVKRAGWEGLRRNIHFVMEKPDPQ